MPTKKPAPATPSIRDRVIDFRRVPASQLVPNPRNWRLHNDAQRRMFRDMLDRIGFAGAELVRALPDGRLMLIDGHMRQEEMGDTPLPVLVTDLSEREADALLASFDPIARLAGTDTDAANALIESLGAAGYDAAADLLAAVAANDQTAALLESLADGMLDYAGAGDGSAEDGDDATPLTPDQARQTLADRFVVPPFSVLDARQGYWQERKRAWIALGIQSELGRGESTLDFSASCVGITDPDQRAALHSTRRADPKRAHDNGLLGESEQARSHYKMGATPAPVGRGGLSDQLAPRTGGEATASYKAQGRQTALQRTGDSRAVVYGTAGNVSTQSGTSIFDPVLCEVIYRWFCPPNGTVLDPFAGGSVRGIVAAKLGRRYVGVDLRAEQVAANRQQAQAICQDTDPRWLVGDSRDLDKLCGDVRADLVFTCPPYYDLEVYSDDPADLSTAGTYDAFLADYRAILHADLAHLRPNRFACVVVGDVRDPQGYYRNFVADTIAIMQDGGARLYNEAILVTAVGSLPVRVGRQFSAGRKLGKTHQNVLVFCKGDARAATEACGTVEVALPEDMQDDGATN